MKAKRLILSIVFLILLSAVAYVVYYCWLSFPIISGYGAQKMCSEIFVAGRNEEQVRKQDLNFYPISLGSFTINREDSSVTGTVFGFAKRKAIYRPGLGAILVSELSEATIRARQYVPATLPNVDQDSIAWPMGNKITDSLPPAINKAELLKAVQNGFAEKDTAKPVRTRAIVVVYDGKIVAEQYAPGFTKNSRLHGWSMTKTVTAALIGRLVKQDRLNIDSPAPVPEWSNQQDPRHGITIRNLLQQSSGLHFLEDYSKASDATRMLFEKADMGGYTALHPLKHTPGKVFYYSSGNSNILSRIVRQTVGDSNYHKFVYDSLLYELGMYSAVIEPDASGTFVGSSYMFATARDWARFGLLYINNGVYNNKRLLPENWVQLSATPANSTLFGEYGFQIWLNKGAKGHPENRHYPHAPTDMMSAEGVDGQYVFIIPSKKLVIVRLGLTQNDNFNEDSFLDSILKSIR